MSSIRLAMSCIALGVSGLISTAWAEECKLQRFASIPMTITPGGEMLLDASVNGESVKLRLETGSTHSLIDEGYVNAHGLPRADREGGRYGLAGTELHRGTQLKQLVLGNGVATDVFMGVGHIASAGGAVGVLGTDSMQDFDLEIDPAAGRLNEYLSGQCPGQVVYWAKEFSRLPVYVNQRLGPSKQMVAVIKVNDIGLHAVIDTGVAATMMRLVTAEASFGFSSAAAKDQPTVSVQGDDGTVIEAVPYKFDSLTFGDITLHNTPVLIADTDVARNHINTGSKIVGAPNQVQVRIGTSLLRRLHMFMAYGEQAIYYTVEDAKPAPTE